MNHLKLRGVLSPDFKTVTVTVVSLTLTKYFGGNTDAEERHLFFGSRCCFIYLAGVSPPRVSVVDGLLDVGIWHEGETFKTAAEHWPLIKEAVAEYNMWASTK